jgi:branched-chain amino acid transport system permease protein
MSKFMNLFAAGIASGATYGVFGACLTIWFRVCNVLNLAVGDFAMLGGLGTAVLIQVHGVPLGWAIVLDLFGVGLLAYIFDRLVLHFAFDRGRSEHGIVSVFFYTFGLSLAIEGGALLLFGSDLRAAPTLWSGPALHILDFNIERPAVLVIALAVVSGSALWLYLRYTVSGRAASACGESLIGARIAGIDSAKFRRWIFIMTAVLAALFGVLESPIIGFTVQTGPTISLLGVVAAGFAGFRRPGKAVAVGLLIGLAEALIQGYISISNGDVILYGALFCVIIFRPSVLGLSALA